MSGRHVQIVLPTNPRSTFIYPVEVIDEGTEEASS